MAKHDPAPTGAKVQDPEEGGKSQNALPSQVPREAIVSLSLGEIARVGVGLGRVRMWLSGHSQELHDEDLGAFDAAMQIIADIHEQVGHAATPTPQAMEMDALIRDRRSSNVYQRLADMMGVLYRPSEVGSVLRLARSCVAKLEHDKLRKG